jgi:hypothetical protein
MGKEEERRYSAQDQGDQGDVPGTPPVPQRETGIHPQSLLRVEAPPSLNEGQNFYDQEPFATVLQAVAKEHQFDLSVMRYALSSLASASSIQEMTPQELAEWGQGVLENKQQVSRLDYIISAKKVGGRKAELKRAVHRMFGQLADYPYVIDYISSKLSRDFYRYDGDYAKTTKSDFQPISSYAHYASERQKLEATLFRQGIAEVFPQQFGGQSMEETTRATGKTGGHRRYILLKASEITKPK